MSAANEPGIGDAGRSSGPADALRRQALERLGGSALPRHDPPAAAADAERLLAELRIHQIELEMQNEELRRAQEALELSRARYFDLYDLAPVGYVNLSERGLIREANLAAATLLGVARGALIGQPLSRFVLPEDQDILYRCRQRLFATHQPQCGELRLRRSDGEPGWVSLDANLGADDSGEPCWRLTLGDIGERKRAEAALAEENRSKDRFIAVLGHELRNPLAPIRHVAEILRLDPTIDADKLRRLTEILSRQAAHLARLVDDVLDIARIRSGSIRLARQSCDLRQIVACATEQAAPILQPHGQRLEMRLPDRPVVVDGDPLRLAQAIVNLLRNASQFSPPQSPVYLTLESCGDRAVVEIRDVGVGIAPQMLPRLFAPFVQTESPPAGGLGLGLALVKGLIELHGGEAQAQSPGPGGGSVFALRLPLARGPAASVALAPVQTAPSAHRILLVEDHPDVAEACAILLRLLGQQVETAASGPAALEAAERLCPDLILLDLGLPGMDGFEVARRLRSTPCGRSARLVALTGYGQPADRARSRAAGFDEHLVKPLGREALVDALSRCPVIH